MYQTYISYNIKDITKILLNNNLGNKDSVYSILTHMVIYNTTDDRVNIAFGLCGPNAFEDKYELVINCGEMNSTIQFTTEESPLGIQFIEKIR